MGQSDLLPIIILTFGLILVFKLISTIDHCNLPTFDIITLDIYIAIK